MKWSGSSLISLWKLPPPGRLTLLPSPTNSSRIEQGMNSCSRRSKQEVSRWWLWITHQLRFPFSVPHLNVFRLALPLPSGATASHSSGLSLQRSRLLVSALPNGFLPTISLTSCYCAAQISGLIHSFVTSLYSYERPAPGSLSGCRPAVQPRSTTWACFCFASPSFLPVFLLSHRPYSSSADMQCTQAHCLLFHDCSELVLLLCIFYFICFMKFWLTSYLLHLRLLPAPRVCLLQLCLVVSMDVHRCLTGFATAS